MKVIFGCVVCGSKDLDKKIGSFAPFIAHKMLDYPVCQIKIGDNFVFPTIYTNSIKCKCCGFVFSQVRPDNDEMGRIYAGYRGRDYVYTRNLFEPGYESINDKIGNCEQETEARQAAMANFLGGVVPFDAVKSVLDYGGDKGQHIPRSFSHCQKHVYDISNVGVVNGVNIVNSLDMVDAIDFVMASNVFEHLSYPMQTMCDLRSICHKKTYLFIDVPLEIEDDETVADPWQPSYFHEHINFFNQKSLSALLHCSGFEICKIEVQSLDLGWVRSKAIYALAQPVW